jgi:tetratricopeptide (TPR) repeat protein
MNAARFSRNKLWVAATFCLLTLLAYSDSFATGFTLDSAFIVLRDPRLLKVAAANLQQILNQDYWWPNFHSGLYRPLTTATFLFNYAVLGNGTHAAGYHAVNILLHLANVWLLFLLASRFFGRAWPAFFAAALWAVHPIATETVTNLVGRSDELAAMAILGGLLLYQRSAPLRGRRMALAAAGLFVIGVLGGLAKELAAVLIAVMLLWDLVRGTGSWRSWRGWLQLRWPFYLAAVLALGVFFAARWRVLGAAPPAEIPYVDNPLAYAGIWTAKLTALKVIGLDLWMMIFPVHLSCDRSYNQIPLAGWTDPAAWAAILVVGGLLAAAILRRRKDPMMFWCAGFCAIALFPTSNLAATIGSVMAERFLYLPSAAFALAITALAFRSKWRRHAPVVLGLLIALYAVRTYLRNADWQDDLTLASHDVAVVPQSFKMHGMLARMLLEQSRSNIDASIHEAEIAWGIVRRLPPERVFTQTPTNLGIYYREKGDQSGGPASAGGRAWYLRALAVLLEARTDSLAYGDAYDELQQADGKPLAVRLERSDLYLALGVVYHGLGQYEQARDAYIYGRKLAPTELNFYSSLAANYLSGGNPQWAAITMEEKMFLDGAQPGTVAILRDLFKKIPGGGCALNDDHGVYKLNVGCPAVNMCLTWLDLAQTYFQGRNRGEALAVKRTALERGCPANLFGGIAP